MQSCATSKSDDRLAVAVTRTTVRVVVVKCRSIGAGESRHVPARYQALDALREGEIRVGATTPRAGRPVDVATARGG
jgi:hypothetical protein